MATVPSAVQDAPSPFDGRTRLGTYASDVVIRSADGFDFHLHKVVLACVSVYFRRVFAIPTPDHGPNAPGRDGKRVLVVSCSCDPLVRLLHFSYIPLPMPTFTDADLDGIVAVVAAARQYEFKITLAWINRELQHPRLIDTQPHRLFAIATSCSLPEVARKAAISTLSIPMCPDMTFPEMELLSWSATQTLIDFHNACGTKSVEIIQRNADPAGAGYIGQKNFITRHHITDETLVWWQPRYHSEACWPREARSGSRAPLGWFQDHIGQLAALVRIAPSSGTIKTIAGVLDPATITAMKSCPPCVYYAEGDLASFAHQLKPAIDHAHEEIVHRTFPTPPDPRSNNTT